jgi:hypothetical protein
MSEKLPSRPRSGDVQSFIDRLSGLPAVKPRAQSQRLIFALDATASREQTWQSAQKTQIEMFEVAAGLGGIEIQLCYYRGVDDFQASAWTSVAAELRQTMSRVDCISGYTQIARVLQHVARECRTQPLRAFVFVGDCVEESAEELAHHAGALALLGVRAFMFQEGRDPAAERTFRKIAEITGGAYSRFDSGSAAQLRDLLGAVAAFATGGLTALERYGAKRGANVLQITNQLKKR